MRMTLMEIRWYDFGKRSGLPNPFALGGGNWRVSGPSGLV
jgi:hypothetical protein